MPYFNQKGPENRGPMTGRKLGRCVWEGAWPDQTDAEGFGWNIRREAGERWQANRFPGGGRRARRAGGCFAPAGTADPGTRDDLARRINALEMALESVKKELTRFSDP